MSTDAWQVNNGRRWCWTTAAYAAWATVHGFAVRLVGPAATDAPGKPPMYAIEYGADGLACAARWTGATR